MMLKNIVIALLILLVSIQVFDRFGLMAYYQLNKAYMTELFCINKERPELQCQAMCYVNSKLQIQEEEKEKIPLRISDKKDIQYCNKQYNSISKESLTSNRSTSSFFFKDYISRPIVKGIFHPPRA
ncbi:MAG: hypothetical protein AAF990_12260 [Bacteroidota bacterium]